jgi:hypothetical protein
MTNPQTQCPTCDRGKRPAQFVCDRCRAALPPGLRSLADRDQNPPRVKTSATWNPRRWLGYIRCYFYLRRLRCSS